MDIALLTPAKGGDSRPEPRNGAPGQSGASSPFAAEYHKARHSGSARQEAPGAAGQEATASAVPSAPGNKSRPASADERAHAGEASETTQPGAQTATPAAGAALADAATLSTGVAVSDADLAEAARTAREAAALPDTAQTLALDPLARDIALANGEILLGGESVDFSGIWHERAHAGEASETTQPGAQTATPAAGAALADAATLSTGVAVSDADLAAAARTAREAAALPDASQALALDPLARDIALANGEILLGGESVDFSGIWQQTARLETKKDDQDTLAAPLSLNLALADVRERLAAIQQAGQAPAPTSGERSTAVAGSMPGLQALLAEQAPSATQPTSQAGDDQAFDATMTKLQSATPPTGDATLQGTTLQNTMLQGATLSKADRAGLESLATNAGISGTESGSSASSSHHLAAAMPQAPGAQAQPTVGPGSPPMATATLSPPVASSEWGAALSQQLVRIQQRGDQRVELHLNPTELGPLSVSLKLGEQQAQLHFSSAHASVRAAVEAAIPQLREALADSGISLGEAMVSDQGQFSQNPFSQEQSEQQAGSGRPGLVDNGLADIGESIAGSAETRDLDVSGAISLYA
ncbi:hypothetical protein GCM10027040_26700 [Halomonas shantousis]